MKSRVFFIDGNEHLVSTDVYLQDYYVSLYTSKVFIYRFGQQAETSTLLLSTLDEGEVFSTEFFTLRFRENVLSGCDEELFSLSVMATGEDSTSRPQ